MQVYVTFRVENRPFKSTLTLNRENTTNLISCSLAACVQHYITLAAGLWFSSEKCMAYGTGSYTILQLKRS